MPRHKGGRRGTENYGALNPMANNQAKNRQDIIERMYLRILGELAMNRFEWKGFPSSVDTRWLEMSLYRGALAVVWVDDTNDAMWAMQGVGVGTKNRIDNYTTYRVYGPSFPGLDLNIRKCEPVWANYLRMPDLDIVRVYAHKLAVIDRTLEINSNNARQTKIITVSENGQLTAKALQTAIDSGQQAVEVSVNVNDIVTALDIGVDGPLMDSLAALRSKFWNECMGLLGINNSNQEKKERLVEKEVGANDDQVNTQRRVNLNARQAAAKAITAKFAAHLKGAEVTVDYYTEIDGAELPAPLTVGGDENGGDVHDASLGG